MLQKFMPSFALLQKIAYILYFVDSFAGLASVDFVLLLGTLSGI